MKQDPTAEKNNALRKAFGDLRTALSTWEQAVSAANSINSLNADANLVIAEKDVGNFVFTLKSYCDSADPPPAPQPMPLLMPGQKVLSETEAQEWEAFKSTQKK